VTTAQTDPSAEATPALPHILTAIKNVMSKVYGVAKAGEFRQTKGSVDPTYYFQKYDDMAAAIGAAFRDEGVMTQGRIVELKTSEWEKTSGTTGTSTRWCRVILRKEFIFTSLVDGTHVQIEAAGEGTGGDDKSTNKAETSAYKNALKQALTLSTGEADPDQTRSDDTGRPVERAVNDPWRQAEAVVEQAAREAVQGDLSKQPPRQFSPDQVEKARKVQAAIPQCGTTGDLDRLIRWALGWDLLPVRVDGQLLGARLIAAKATLPAGPPTHAEQATRPGEHYGDRDV
jgi:hypothetical protein